MKLRAPFPWFGGKSRAAHLIWPRFGDVPNYIEPFAGSLANLLMRPAKFPPRVETVNDKDAYLCVTPETRILRGDLTWSPAGQLQVGDDILAFDEENPGEAREGLRAPTAYRKWRHGRVDGVPRIKARCYRLTFDDGTQVTVSEDHRWLAGSHESGGRGWRWVTTKNLVANRKTQRSWVLKLLPAVEPNRSWEAGWIAGVLDGEGHIHRGHGTRVQVAQNDGIVLNAIEAWLTANNFDYHRGTWRKCRSIALNGGLKESLRLLMLTRPRRLLKALLDSIETTSIYGRDHQAVGLVSKEFVGELEVVALSTTTKTYVAEGLASHNCNFWRAVHADPDAVAYYADWPVNETDLHARHRWLVTRGRRLAARCSRDPHYFNAKVAGWWVWGQCLWIGSGWCARPEWTGRVNVGRWARGIHTDQYMQRPDMTSARGLLKTRNGDTSEQARRPQLTGDQGIIGVAGWQKRPSIGHRGGRGVIESRRRWNSGGAGAGQGVHAPRLTQQMPRISAEGGSISGVLSDGVQSVGLYVYMRELCARLRRVRICCGDWTRVLTPSVTTYIGVTGVLLDPPYSHSERSICYSNDEDISAAVRAWALEHGDDPKFRIALCGYEGEHEMPDSWERVPWTAGGGYGRSARGKANRHRERIWFSPHCLKPASGLPFGADGEMETEAAS